MRRKWLLISLSLVVLLPALLIAAAVALIKFTDLAQHRDLIAEQASNILGRRLTLDGELELNLGSTTSIVVSDVSLANAVWASEADLLAVKRFEAEIEIMPLLRGDIRIPRLHVDGVNASLETNTDGSGNWILTGPDAHAQTREHPSATGDLQATTWKRCGSCFSRTSPTIM